MTITISLSIQLEASDLAIFNQLLTVGGKQLVENGQQPTANRYQPTAQEAPDSHETPVLVPTRPADAEMVKIEAIQPATEEASVKPEYPKQPRSGDRLPFEQFDPLVRKEIKRLAMDGRIPGAKLWDSERDSRLPTYAAVMQRYNARSVAEFAEKMGMQPPLGKALTINANRVSALPNGGETVS